MCIYTRVYAHTSAAEKSYFFIIHKPIRVPVRPSPARQCTAVSPFSLSATSMNRCRASVSRESERETQKKEQGGRRQRKREREIGKEYRERLRERGREEGRIVKGERG